MTALGVAPRISAGRDRITPEDLGLSKGQVCRLAVKVAAEHGLSLHPAEARRIAAAFMATGYRSAEAFLAWLDPTGQTAADNVDRERGRRG